MGFTVDVKDLATRFRWLRRWLKPTTYELVVEVEGLDRRQAFDLVTAAWKALAGGDRGFEIYPTGPGPTILSSGTDWREMAEGLAASLEGQGWSGRISAPSVDLGDPPLFPPTCQGLYMAHRLAVPVDQGPFNPWGVPEPEWRVPEPASDRVMDRLVEWTLGPDYIGAAGFPPVAVTAENARDVLEVVYEYSSHELRGWNAHQTLMRRAVNRSALGQTVWYDAAPALSVAERADGLVGLLREFAPDLTYGFIQTTKFLGMRNHDTWLWSASPHLWDQYVPDAFAIQLVPGATLAKAHDLSSWTIEQVATDRYLVTAQNLHPWLEYTKPERLIGSYSPLPEPLTRARNDFGAMILTKEIHDANPLQRPQ